MRRLVLALGLLLSTPAFAAVIYKWQTTNPNGAASSIGGRLVFDDQAWLSGSVDYLYTPPCLHCPVGDPLSPVLLFQFYVNGQEGWWTYHDYRTNFGFEDGQSSRISASFGAGDHLIVQELWSGGTFASVRILGDTVEQLSSEARPGSLNDGCWVDVCGGQTGVWVLDRSTMPVSAPGTLSLAALALIAGASRKARRCK